MPAIYFERTNKAKERIEKTTVIIFLLALIAAITLAITDFYSMPDPNASECKLGFSETGCHNGYECRGVLIECRENGVQFKYFFTGWLFDKPRCRAARIYREICIPPASNP